MQETLFKSPRLKAWRRTGSEGPRHDPYAYEEITVETPSGETTLHMGLGVWLDHNGHRIKPDFGNNYEASEKELITTIFPKLTGWTMDQINRFHTKLKSRCRKCGSTKGTTTETGYPGEYLEICVNCGHIGGGYFCRGEIE